jgi:hypothetical protein
MPNCPYCGVEKRALKNHVRLSSGDGHGPSGSYPGDFDGGSSTERAQSDGGQQLEAPDDEGADAGPDEDGLHFEEDEFDELVTNIESSARSRGYEEGMEEGYEVGYQDAEHELTPEAKCPGCGQEMREIGEKGKFVLTRGWISVKWMEHYPKNRICTHCDILKQGDVFYWGDESDDPGKYRTKSSA